MWGLLGRSGVACLFFSALNHPSLYVVKIFNSMGEEGTMSACSFGFMLCYGFLWPINRNYFNAAK